MKIKSIITIFTLIISLSAISLSVFAQNINQENNNQEPKLIQQPLQNIKETAPIRATEMERIRKQERLAEKATTTISANTKAVREKIEKRREEFRQKLTQIKKENYRNLAQRLYENLNRVNKNMSNAEMNHLKALDSFLDRIEEKTNTDQEKINLTRQKIAQAKEIISSQESKEYIIEITSENNLGKDIRKLIQELKEDHKNIRQNTIKPIHDLIKEIIND